MSATWDMNSREASSRSEATDSNGATTEMTGESRSNYTTLSNEVEALRKRHSQLRDSGAFLSAFEAQKHQLHSDIHATVHALTPLAEDGDRYHVLLRHCHLLIDTLDAIAPKAPASGPAAPNASPSRRRANSDISWSEDSNSPMGNAQKPKRQKPTAKKRKAQKRKSRTVHFEILEPKPETRPIRRLPIISVDRETGKHVVRLVDTGPDSAPEKPVDPAGHRQRARSRQPTSVGYNPRSTSVRTISGGLPGSRGRR